MTAQRPGAGLSPSTLDGRRSWVFYDKHIGYDYLTQLPTGERELMFGGGFFQGGDDGLSELGTFDDSKLMLESLRTFPGPYHFSLEISTAELKPFHIHEGRRVFSLTPPTSSPSLSHLNDHNDGDDECDIQQPLRIVECTVSLLCRCNPLL